MELETAVERLYTDESLAADVDDKTAVPLLKWAESVLPVLVARGDEGFDDAFMTLKKLIKSVARLIDMRGEIDMTERADRAEKIQGFAQELGIPVNVDHLESLASFDGPELVAQMVGGATAFAVPPPTGSSESETTTTETADSARTAAEPDTAAPQAVSDSGLPIEPRPGAIPFSSGIPEDVAELRTAQNDKPSLPAATQVEPALPTLIPDVPAEPAIQEPPPVPAEKPSLLDGLGSFFKRVTERLDDKQTPDHTDDKE